MSLLISFYIACPMIHIQVKWSYSAIICLITQALLTLLASPPVCSRWRWRAGPTAGCPLPRSPPFSPPGCNRLGDAAWQWETGLADVFQRQPKPWTSRKVILHLPLRTSRRGSIAQELRYAGVGDGPGRCGQGVKVNPIKQMQAQHDHWAKNMEPKQGWITGWKRMKIMG